MCVFGRGRKGPVCLRSRGIDVHRVQSRGAAGRMWSGADPAGPLKHGEDLDSGCSGGAPGGLGQRADVTWLRFLRDRSATVLRVNFMGQGDPARLP